MDLIYIFTGIVLTLGILGFGINSFYEKEKHAGWMATGLSLGFALIWFSAGLIWPGFTAHFLVIFLVVAGLLILILSLPLGQAEPLKIDSEATERFDERHVIFGRMELIPGLPQYEVYYEKMNPRQRRFDDHLRAMPSIGDPGGQYADQQDSPYFQAIFRFIDGYKHLADPGQPTNEPVSISSADATRRIKGFAKHLGAIDVRITRVKDYHIYACAGRHLDNWGTPYEPIHPYAVVLSVEMEHPLVQSAPLPTQAVEAATEYMRGANISIILATYIHMLGFKARAHMDGNYQAMVTALAHEAGIGELGRIGLIITPTHGPRIRLAAVTTDLPLVEDKPINFGVQDFCRFCKKCADNCPSGSIDTGEKRLIRGVTKWQTNMESCFQQWKKFGTDCAICMAVCPYSKPNTFYHRLVRFFARRNRIARRLALLMDDIFYTRRPRHAHTPSWFNSYDKDSS